MAYKYCDWATGNDTTGDGSYGNPWKTITKLTTSWNGSDILRVGKSPDNAARSGTLTFTAGSTTLTGSGTAFTTELAIGDFVLGADSVPYEVVTISSNTAAVLYQKYPSSTQSGVACVKVGMISTGAATGSTTQIQIISSSGTSAVANMMISGGWNLSTQTQTGVTNFKQMHDTFANRYGYGLYATGKSYFTIEKCGFFRYNYGFYLASSSDYNTINTVIGMSCNNSGIYLNSSNDNVLNSPICSANNSSGLYLNGSNRNVINTATCNACGGNGLYVSSGNLNTINTATCKFNSNAGINFSSANNNTISTANCDSNYYGLTISSSHGNAINTVTCTSSGYVGMYFSSASKNIINAATCNSTNGTGIYLNNAVNNNVFNTLTCNSNSSGAFAADNSYDNTVNKFSGIGNIALTPGTIVPILEIPLLSIQYYNAKGTNKNWFYQGITESNTAEADGGSGMCLHYDPSSATLYMSHSFLFKAVDNTAYTITAKVKKKNSFNGDVQGAVFFLGVPVIDWTDITPTNADAYETKTFNVTSGMVTDNSCLELRIKVRGTAGDIYVDTLGIS